MQFGSRTWLLLIVVLAAGAVLSASFMRRMSRPLPKYEPDKLAVPVSSPQTISTRAQARPTAVSRNLVKANYDSLWRQTLFKDTRTEDSSTASVDESVAKADEEQVNSEFELIGIVRIGPVDSAIPVAIILPQANARGRRAMGGQNQRGMPSRGGNIPGRDNRQIRQPGMGGRPGLGGAEPASAEPADHRASRNNYKVGDALGKSGYVVKQISVAENKVVLTRGGVDVNLVLDVKNTRASIRRENAQKAELAARSKFNQPERQVVRPPQQTSAPAPAVNAGARPVTSIQTSQPAVQVHPGQRAQGNPNIPPAPPPIPGPSATDGGNGSGVRSNVNSAGNRVFRLRQQQSNNANGPR